MKNTQSVKNIQLQMTNLTVPFPQGGNLNFRLNGDNTLSVEVDQGEPTSVPLSPTDIEIGARNYDERFRSRGIAVLFRDHYGVLWNELTEEEYDVACSEIPLALSKLSNPPLLYQEGRGLVAVWPIPHLLQFMSDEGSWKQVKDSVMRYAAQIGISTPIETTFSVDYPLFESEEKSETAKALYYYNVLKPLDEFALTFGMHLTTESED